MATFWSTHRRWLAWVIPTLLLVLIIGLQSDWGRSLVPVQKLPPTPVAKPINTALAREYQLPGGLDAYGETISRPLLAPNRRQAPPPPPPAPPQKTIVRGQFTLMGTTITQDKTIALLREVSSGKLLRVNKGEVINGMTVDKIEPNKVTFRLADDTDEVGLKIAAGPRQPTPVPGMPQAVMQPPGMAPAPGVPPPGMAGVPSPAPVPGAPTALEERRRAARAAEQARAQQGDTAASNVQPMAPAQAPPTTDWNTVFQRMQQQQKK